MLVDAHIHAFSHAFFASLEAASAQRPAPVTMDAVAARAGFELPDADPAVHARRWLRDLDRHGVDLACMVASHADEAESVSAMVAASHGRLAGICAVDPTSPGARERIATILGPLGFRGLLLFPGMHRFDAGGIDWLWKLAGEHRAALTIHCGMLSIPLREHFGLPVDADIRLADPLAVIPPARRHPGVTCIIPHFGAGLFRECLIAARSSPNIHVDTSSSNSWVVTAGITVAEAFARAIDCFGPGRIIFGTDSGILPRGFRQDVLTIQRGLLEGFRLGAEDQERIFSLNARRVYGL